MRESHHCLFCLQYSFINFIVETQDVDIKTIE